MRKSLLLIISICLLNFGCVAFHPRSLEKDELGTYKIHHYSCGPQSIRDMLDCIHREIKWIKYPFSSKEISQEIQKTGNGLRLLGSIFHYEFLETTWPHEIEDYFNNHNINFKKINKIQDLKDKNKIVLFLVKGSTLKGEWHWVTFPTHSLNYISNVFGENTEIVLGYVIDE